MNEWVVSPLSQIQPRAIRWLWEPYIPRGKLALAVTKSNIAADVPSLGYRLKHGPSGQPVVEWTGPVAISANELGQTPEAE